MEKRGEEETGEQAQATDCVEEGPKGEKGMGGIKEGGEAKKEVVVATWNVRTLAIKGKNGQGHADPATASTKVTLRHHRIAGGERSGRGSFEAAGYTVYFSGSEKGGSHGVGQAVAKRIVEASGTCTPEPIN